MQFLTLSLGGGGEQTAAVLAGSEDVSVVLISWEDSGLQGASSLSVGDSAVESSEIRADAFRPTQRERQTN